MAVMRPLDQITKRSIASRRYRAKLQSLGKCIYCRQPNDTPHLKGCTTCREKYHQANIDNYGINREKELARKRRQNAKIKLKALSMISGLATPVCVYCGCEDILILTVNHKNGGGEKERKRLNKWGMHFQYLIVKGKRNTDGLEVACVVCNALHYVNLKYPDLGKRFIVKFQ